MVQLRRGDPEVEQEAGDAFDANRVHYACQITECRAVEYYSIPKPFEAFGGSGQCSVVTIQA